VLVLGIDTATQTGGVALLDQEALRGEYLLNVSVTHSERLMRSIQMLMRDSHISGEDITGIAVSLGPGSFTGLRIGVTVAKTLAWVWGCPLVGVSTLKALAIQGAGGELLCPLIDARRENVYAAVYSADFQPVLDPHYTSLTELTDFFQNQGKTVVFLGDAVLRHRETLLDKLPGLARIAPIPDLLLRPASVAHVGLEMLKQGHQDDPFTLKPFYLRQAEAERNALSKRHRGTGP
jgi:tRNA threonylcarbamoyladenosine biosynthesis protein TsaB